MAAPHQISFEGCFSESFERGGGVLSPQLCERFKTLLAGLGLSEEEKGKINDALSLMVASHADQAPRPDGQPYVDHPLSVAITCIEKFGFKDADSICAALLHDTVEDQAANIVMFLGGVVNAGETLEEAALAAIRDKFGNKTADFVGHLTNPDYTLMAKGLIAEGDTRGESELKNILYKEHFFQIYEASPEAFAIKLADFFGNALQIDSLNEGAKKDKLKIKYGPVLKEVIELLKSPEVKIRVRLESIEEMERVYKFSYKP